MGVRSGLGEGMSASGVIGQVGGAVELVERPPSDVVVDAKITRVGLFAEGPTPTSAAP